MSLDDLNLEYLLNNACRIAREAGDRIMEIYGEGFQVEHKSDRSPLTAADMAAHRHIVAGLRDLSPSLPILSEESDQIPFSERSRWQTYWLVDPLDGTREFIKRNGEFTVNIALIHDHEPVLGVVAAPALDRLYSAARGLGAHRHEPAAAAGERIQVNRDRRTQPVIAGSRSHGTERMQQFLERVGEHELISMGSSLKFCLVAEGKADLYPRLGPTSEWDTAAAQCVVCEAGGVVTDLSLSPLRYNTHDGILNPEFLVIADPARGWEGYLPA
ncbi:3'(2'),5'-bisphosphate nucleotidase CysQ [Ectothiorhodospira lacustris]|uniref:3'(2'),5'-bisphosphate nucleotidase CysQ n=1 Tax=Ectothiorhodospira lacustris TaxID=2899127 RepID=UPI001EE7B47B|nr:3'(2'),5'-bisphosphate nucleotidase CysQ [Ectothiorhodospira lacustris]MCG5500138.1 3'(2'),5'-bisphosphate nucleotidase CysQ [Ectothiorhodospira lacustris]MCG5510777.1 3'(2'),5'-bisphosphate nucleotidase CysQ [Ectothiorhodospira lacustris]MCG5522509.1 3'(2'),5'-bisphosphate nucleotidase CysQ [Ectothiorhodospira lacustris]